MILSKIVRQTAKNTIQRSRIAPRSVCTFQLGCQNRIPNFNVNPTPKQNNNFNNFLIGASLFGIIGWFYKN